MCSEVVNSRGRTVAAWLLAVAMSACAGLSADDGPRPYDEQADANAAIAAALADNPERKRVLITFGANWCSDSRVLEAHVRSPELAPLIEREFKSVYIDVGMFHRNLDITQRYGDPIDEGIPAVVLLDADGNTLYVEHGGLSSAGRMRAAAIRSYFERLAETGRPD